jgi:mono/diheme cytochrome c family protein
MYRAATWRDQQRQSTARRACGVARCARLVSGPLRRAAGKAALLAMLISAASAQAAEPTRDGKASFEYHCGKCHDAAGTGTQMLTKRLGKEQALLEKRKGLTVDFVRNAVRHGVLSMPRITRVEVTDAELDAIARYLTSSARTRRSSTSP